MNIAIIGTGAMGCLFAGMLSKCNNVSIVGRNHDTVDIIRRNGISVTEKDNSVNIYRPNSMICSADNTQTFDLAIICVKSYDTLSALQTNKGIIENAGHILTLQNGLGNDEYISKYADKDKILIGTTEHNCSVVSRNEVYHGGNGMTVIGSLSENNDILSEIADNFSQCGIDMTISDNVMKAVWKKLMLNISVNAVTAVMGIPTGFIVKSEYVMGICRKLANEAVKTANTVYGMDFDIKDIMQSVINLSLRQPDAHTSMYNDIKHNRRTEIDSINGAVVKIAERNGLSASYNHMITDMIHGLEMKGKIYEP